MHRQGAQENAVKSFHIDSLYNKFPNTREQQTLQPTTSPLANDRSISPPSDLSGGVARIFEVEQFLNCGSGRNYPMILYVTVPSDFPLSPPKIASSFGNFEIKEFIWEPNKTFLAEAVEDAFEKYRSLWGSDLRPPQLQDVETVQRPLSSLSEDVIEDMLANPFCLESYLYQLPYSKSLRDHHKESLRQVETNAKSNLELRPEIDQLIEDVTQLQDETKGFAEELGAVRSEAKNLLRLSTVDKMLKVYSAELKEEELKSQQLGDQFLHSSTAQNINGEGKTSDEILDEYYLSRCKFHENELKQQAFMMNNRGA